MIRRILLASCVVLAALSAIGWTIGLANDDVTRFINRVSPDGTRFVTLGAWGHFIGGELWWRSNFVIKRTFKGRVTLEAGQSTLPGSRVTDYLVVRNGMVIMYKVDKSQGDGTVIAWDSMILDTSPHGRQPDRVFSDGLGIYFESLSPFASGFRFRLPFWMLLVAFSVYPTMAFLRGPYRRHRRRKKGLCLACAYDLTGNESGVCPECGTVTIAPGRDSES